jgi:hypothetical protein
LFKPATGGLHTPLTARVKVYNAKTHVDDKFGKIGI